MRDPQTLALLTLAATLTLLPWVTGEVHVQCQNSWYGGFHCEVRFNIHQTLTVWQVHIIFEVRVDELQMLDSNVSKISDYDFLVTPKNNDRVANPGDTLVVSFNGFTPGANLNPVICAYIVGDDADGACLRDGITAPPTTATTATTTTPVTKTVYPDHGWGPWSSWSACSQSCGGGTRSISRVCYNPSYWHTDCIGLSYGEQPCNIQHCPLPEQTTTASTTTTPATTTAFLEQTTTTHTTTASTTTPVTTTVDPCLSLTCRPGHCVVHAGFAVCDCSGTGYTGTHCKINPCDSYDCGPGLCERHGTPSAYAVCDCSNTGFTGDHCQQRISIVG